MKKSIKLIFGVCLAVGLATAFTGCATQLPAFDPSLPDSETAILIIPKHIYIVTIDDRSAGWENGQVRIPAGRHTFTITSEEYVLVPDSLGLNALTGYRSNYRRVKQRVGPNTETYTFEAGESYTISSQMYNRGTFDSQFVEYTVNPYTETYPENLMGFLIEAGMGNTWDENLYFGIAIPIKFPNVPIFWDLRLDANYIGVSGDYLIYKRFFPLLDLYGYIGAGIGLGAAISEDTARLAVLGRVPIGISWFWISPDLDKGVEVYLQGVPTLGTTIPDFIFPYGSWSIDIGLRLWYEVFFQ